MGNIGSIWGDVPVEFLPKSLTKALGVEAALLPPECRHMKLAYQYSLRFAKLPNNHLLKLVVSNGPQHMGGEEID